MTDFDVVQGDSKRLVFALKDQDGSAVNLSGVTSITWQAARSVSGPPLISKSLADGIDITSAPGGVFVITLQPQDTASLKGDHYHEAQVIDASGDVSTVYSGTFSIVRGLIA